MEHDATANDEGLVSAALRGAGEAALLLLILFAPRSARVIAAIEAWRHHPRPSH